MAPDNLKNEFNDYDDDAVITTLPPGFVEEFADEILGTIPQEKVQVQLRQEKIARVMKQAGPRHIEDMGQRVAVIDRRLYFRLMQQFGPTDEWLNDFLVDNPMMCAPGYRPKQNGLRHGTTFINGESVSKPKGRVQA